MELLTCTDATLLAWRRVCVSEGLLHYRLGRSRAALVCDSPTERNIRALMAFESFTSSYAYGLRGTLILTACLQTNESKVAAAAARLYGPQSVSKAVKRPLSYGGAATPAE